MIMPFVAEVFFATFLQHSDVVRLHGYLKAISKAHSATIRHAPYPSIIACRK